MKVQARVLGHFYALDAAFAATFNVAAAGKLSDKQRVYESWQGDPSEP